jgi:FkbM family methyltransferase
MQAKMFGLGLVSPIRDKLLGPRDAQVRLRYGGLEIPWTVGAKSDFDVLNEVLVLKVYGQGLLPAEPITILDLGSHMGASVLFWRERFPRARIVAVEPDPITFRRLRRNVGGMAGVELRNVAVSERDGSVRFFPAQQAWISSLSGDGESVTVDGCSFRNLVADLDHVDVLKVDIEGAERCILDDWALQRVGVVVGEYHDSGDAEERERFFAALRRHFDLRIGQTAAFIPFSGSRRAPGPSRRQ